MAQEKNEKKAPRTRSFALVLLAWVFIGGQVLLVAGAMYNLNRPDASGKITVSGMPWQVLAQGATKMRLVATQAQPEVIGNIAVFFAVANLLGIAALVCALLSWSRSRHMSGKLTIAVAMAAILANSLLILPYA
jgi:predicted membrane channel-forming protein YqfA (hemolysin III family)